VLPELRLACYRPEEYESYENQQAVNPDYS